MHARHGFVAVICAAPLLLLSRPASSDDITVNITNDGTEAILVTVYDRSATPRPSSFRSITGMPPSP